MNEKNIHRSCTYNCVFKNKILLQINYSEISLLIVFIYFTEVREQ